MKAAFTPGPWRVECFDLEIMDFAVSDTGRMTEYTIYPPVSKKQPMPIASVQHCFNGKSCKANARLIAAAPELLDALKATLAVLRANGDNFGKAAQLKAFAAITKAEGGAT